ncbi:protein DEK isoform 2-T2 [Spinachia spinachia]
MKPEARSCQRIQSPLLHNQTEADMSQVAEEAMDSSAASEEEEEEQEEQEVEQASPNKGTSKISAAGDVIEGKRAKKTVERLDLQAPKQKEKLKIGDGRGDKLGDIPRTGHHITKMKQADLKPLHAILFDRPGKMATLKKNLRLFNGFPFDADSEPYLRKREKLLRNSNFTNAKLKAVCGVLDLEKKGTHSDLVDRILSFLIAPRNSGKRLPVKKKRKSKKKLSGDDSTSNTKKKSQPKPNSSSSSSSPKKSKAGSKSKAIVMETSSDEDENEGADTEDKPEEEEEEETFVSAAAKRSRTLPEETGPPKKKAKKEALDESHSVGKPKKKKPAPFKPAAKSSSRRNANATDDSDSADSVITMTKKPPSEEKLKETVQRLLEEVHLEEFTMKQICQKVFDMYPENDLSSKKDYIKQTVKSQRAMAVKKPLIFPFSGDMMQNPMNSSLNATQFLNTNAERRGGALMISKRGGAPH